MTRAARDVAAILSAAVLTACTAEQKSATTDTSGSTGPQATSTAATGTAGPSGARIAVAHAGPPGEIGRAHV